jgi:hexokinase
VEVLIGGGSQRLMKHDRLHSVAEFLPNFEARMRAALREVLGVEGEQRIKMGLAKDGSGVGGEQRSASSLTLWFVL